MPAPPPPPLLLLLLLLMLLLMLLVLVLVLAAAAAALVAVCCWHPLRQSSRSQKCLRRCSRFWRLRLGPPARARAVARAGVTRAQQLAPILLPHSGW